MSTNHRETFVTIGLNISYYRKKRGLTQAKLAEKTFYSEHHIQQIETAEETPSVDALLDIADALEIPVVKLFEER